MITSCGIRQIAIITLCFHCIHAPVASAEVFIRWDQDQIPSRDSLGISTVVIPSSNAAAVDAALAQGYRVFIEVDAAAAATFKAPVESISGIVLTGTPSAKDVQLLKQRLKSPSTRVLAVDGRGKWPHIRTNWVTANKGVLQVTSHSSQPWIENNAALVRIDNAQHPGITPVLTYPWKPITLSDVDEGPALENYLVAIAEAGSFGADLVLPLHPRFEKSLLLGQPRARAEWNEIVKYVEFYSWNLPSRYEAVANIAVITSDPMPSFEMMNLLTRHNLPFELIAPTAPAEKARSFDLVIALDELDAAVIRTLAEFAQRGGAVIVANSKSIASPAASTWPWRAAAPVTKSASRATYRLGEGRVLEVSSGIGDPNAFAMEVRQVLGPEHRVIDIWNGITVLTAPFREPGGDSVLLTVLNYTAQPLPVQLRIKGTFRVVQYESPGEAAVLLPYEHRNGCTEFVLPALKLGGRVFLNQNADKR
jgi:hypothetical protein